MRKLSQISERMLGQPMFKILASAKQLEERGQRVIHFEIGDLNIGSPMESVEAAIASLRAGKTRYTRSRGITELIEAIRQNTKSNYGFLPSEEQIMVSPANAVIDFCIRCTANPGDEVLLPDPGFPTYYSVLSYTGISAVPVPLRQEDGFQMRADEISQRVSSKSRLIIINSPQNPTGSVISEDEVIRIFDVAKRHDLYLLSDEVYTDSVFEGVAFSPATQDFCKERTILLKSLSKNYSMTGWRIGYAIGPERLIEKMTLLQETILSCLPEFTQLGARAALALGQSPVRVMLEELRDRRDRLVRGLNAINGIQCANPSGAFYVFPRIEHPGVSSFEFSERLLEEEGICILPGVTFGSMGKGFFRLAYSNVSFSDIDDALIGLTRFMNGNFSTH